MTIEAKQIFLIERPAPDSYPSTTHLQPRTVTIDPDSLQSGEFIVKIQYVSIDPTYKGWMTFDSYVPAVPLNGPMRAIVAGVVSHSNAENFNVGDHVYGMGIAGEYQLVSAENAKDFNIVAQDTLDAIGGLENYLVVMGITGFPTAYVGLMVTVEGWETEGKTAVVTGASGNVGQWVVQIAKHLLKMRVIGVAGGDEKCKYLVEDLGCDGAINYKEGDFATKLKEQCPDGIDLYFDNVGGEQTEIIVSQMNNLGRISLCGLISSYNTGGWAFQNYAQILIKSITVQGFIVLHFPEKLAESYEVGTRLVAEGKLKWRTHPLDGIENFVPALDLLWSGDKIGDRKSVV